MLKVLGALCALLLAFAAQAQDAGMSGFETTSWLAIRKDAAGVRLPTRVCSIQSFPRSTVNSTSHRSR